MASLPVLLVNNTLLATAPVDYYTSPTGQSTTITSFTLNVPKGGQASVRIYVVPGGSSPGDANHIHTVQIEEGSGPVMVPELVAQVLPPGYSLTMSASNASVVSPLVSGRREAS